MYKTNYLQLHCENWINFELFIARKTCIILDLNLTLDKIFRFVLEWLVVYLLETKSTFIVSRKKCCIYFGRNQGFNFLLEFPIFDSLSMK